MNYVLDPNCPEAKKILERTEQLASAPYASHYGNPHGEFAADQARQHIGRCQRCCTFNAVAQA